MKEVKELLDKFVRDEALAYDARRKPDYEFANLALKKMHEHTVSALNGQMGLIYNSKNERPEYYEKRKNKSSYRPRRIYKISNYKHHKYLNVWVAYVSEVNPYDDFKMMGQALFVIKEDEKLLIAKQYIYSDYSSEGYEYTWDPLQGYKDLTFDSLGQFIETERYEEPIDDQDSMKMYKENK